mmetsp:Transcript_165/g.327  ORF Transcript_165/g.327 Transcript_165/m.327 type:complete len:211 (+) Transcript_165:531-1163(+)
MPLRLPHLQVLCKLLHCSSKLFSSVQGASRNPSEDEYQLECEPNVLDIRLELLPGNLCYQPRSTVVYPVQTERTSDHALYARTEIRGMFSSSTNMLHGGTRTSSIPALQTTCSERRRSHTRAITTKEEDPAKRSRGNGRNAEISCACTSTFAHLPCASTCTLHLGNTPSYISPPAERSALRALHFALSRFALRTGACGSPHATPLGLRDF